MTKVLDLVDIQGSDISSKQPASSTACVPVAKRPALSRMSVNEEGDCQMHRYTIICFCYLYYYVFTCR